ncbi:hypothetical protein E2562_031837 [Oryza meyeriana var. granulata]|uniref:Uncharacterized protein n=1 Tax=Oryza meyeriana var. granulata TaxID=110450 RepID=A0A6G1CW31_9ORYZ|nr:hypothetical protein E2562_031837 [Oryza meyeriana var. granulata]
MAKVTWLIPVFMVVDCNSSMSYSLLSKQASAHQSPAHPLDLKMLAIGHSCPPPYPQPPPAALLPDARHSGHSA